MRKNQDVSNKVYRPLSGFGADTIEWGGRQCGSSQLLDLSLLNLHLLKLRGSVAMILTGYHISFKVEKAEALKCGGKQSFLIQISRIVQASAQEGTSPQLSPKSQPFKQQLLCFVSFNLINLTSF